MKYYHETPDKKKTEFATLKEAAKFAFWESIRQKRVGIEYLEEIYLVDTDGEEYIVHPQMILDTIKKNFVELIVQSTEENNYYKKIEGAYTNVLVTFDKYNNTLYYHPVTEHGSLNTDESRQQLYEMTQDTIYDQMIPIAHIWTLHGSIHHVVSLAQEAAPSNNRIIEASRA